MNIELSPADRARLLALKARPAPDWLANDKLGIMFQWGLSAIPAWAPTEGDIGEIAARNPENSAAFSPYAEWYWNSMRLPASPTAAHHAATYGPDVSYEAFAPPFKAAAAALDIEAWCDLVELAGARHAVLVTKHHDGFLLWPSTHANPHRAGWHCERDLVGEFAAGLRDRGLRFGVYYSGGLDWTFSPGPSRNLLETLMTCPVSAQYARYCAAHYRELIDRYRPTYLWNDIAYPTQEGLLALFQDYYAVVPDGAVNDRWLPARELRAGFTGQAEELARLVTNIRRERRAPPPLHADVITPEYAQLDSAGSRAWETVRGVGVSFGHNQNESPQTLLSTQSLIQLLADIVSKGGNLLLSVALRADGSPCPQQLERVRGLGNWLRRNGAAVFGTRPWAQSCAKTQDGGDVRFTRKGDDVFAIIWRHAGPTVSIVAPGLAVPERVRSARGEALNFACHPGEIVFDRPAECGAHAFTVCFQGAGCS